ncbi:hypothetical protein AHAS_Ahas15G0198200 [Arachis hypogaea]
MLKATKGAWHARLSVARQVDRGTPNPSHTIGVPLELVGVARQFIHPEEDTHWACHLISKAWHASTKPSLGHAT